MVVDTKKRRRAKVRGVPPIDMALAAVLRRVREDRGLSQEAVARRADISLVTLARIEDSPQSPAKSSPTWWTVSQIAVALRLSLEELGRMVDMQREDEAEDNQDD
jgi:DNA-binding XRE family transcriptional regulator